MALPRSCRHVWVSLPGDPGSAPAKSQMAGSQEAISPSFLHFQGCILNL